MIATRLRIGLVAVTVAGAVYLDPAQAAVAIRQDECEEFVRLYMNRYCTDKGGQSSDVTYTCHPDGSVTIHSVVCVSPG